MNCIREICERIRESKRLNEMAVINPQLCKQLPIQVEVEQRSEGPIPHVHVYLDNSRNPRNCAYIRLDIPEYSPHHKKGKHLKDHQKESFLKIMASEWSTQFIQSRSSGEIKKATGYEAAVKIWTDTYGESDRFTYDDAGYPVMPDYENI